MLFKAVAKANTHARRLRNDFAHQLWGESPEIPHVLLLIEAECITDAELSWAVASLTKGAPPQGADKSKIKVWDVEALWEAKGIVHEAMLTVAELWMMLMPPIHPSPSLALTAADGARMRLLKRPLVALALQQLSQKKTP